MAGTVEATAQYKKLSQIQKAMLLTRASHDATIAARESYIPTSSNPERTFENPDAILLRDANNFIHRVTGYLMHVLDGTDNAEQDEFVIEMIEGRFDKKHLFDMLRASTHV
jgi:hypothetical protein